MDYQVILSDRFLNDLEEVVDYLSENAGGVMASRLANRLLDRAMAVARNPFIGQPVHARLGARKIQRHPYLIYYDVDEKRQRVDVLRLWHGARDPKSLSFDDSEAKGSIHAC